MSQVTETWLHESLDRLAALPVRGTAAPPWGRLAIVDGLTEAAVGLLVQVVSPGKTVSVTVQLARSADPLLLTLTVKLLVADPPHCATVAGHCFVTVSPGVRHWKFASSNAVRVIWPGVVVQSHVTVALSGSFAAKV